MKNRLLTSALALAITALSAASAQTITTLTTTADGSMRLERGEAAITTSTHKLITLLPGEEMQTIDGFGYAITYSSCYNLLHMTEADRHAFLEQTFSPTLGYGASYVRISIGCNDFSSREYTLCDEPGLEHFALQSDETQYVVPVLKEIMAINPDLKVIAAPWTPPRWMKVNSLEEMKPWNEWTDGHLNPSMRKTYAQYFVKFVRAMAAEGISIYAVSPQNEPLNKKNCASLYMPWSEEAELLKVMAPELKRAGLKTKIYVFDHNYNYDNIASQRDYPIHVYDELKKESFDGSELIVGAAYHDYGGSNEELSDIHGKAPAKELMFSETSIGTWNDGRDLSRRLVADMKNIVIGTTQRWSRAALVWNLMLDNQRGPNLDGGCQTCFGAVDINSDDYRTISYNSHYYIISHAAAGVKPGATRIATTGWQPQGLDCAAFRNADGSCALLLASDCDHALSFSIAASGKSASITMPAHSVMTVVIQNQELTNLK